MKLPLVIRETYFNKISNQKNLKKKNKRINFYLRKMAAPVLDIKLNVKASDMEDDSIVKIN